MAEPEYLTVEHLALKDIIRIFSKVEVDPVTECWNWTASLNKDGYGNVCYKSKHARTERTHRLMYAWLVESIPRGFGLGIPSLDHEVCNNRRCCNPAHLVLGPHKINTLRGSSFSAINSRKTHCARGHLLPAAPNAEHGKRRRCLVCRREYSRKSMHKRTQTGQQREYMKRYRLANLERSREYGREQQRRRRATNPEATREYARNYEQAHREENRERKRKYCREYMRKRRAAKRAKQEKSNC